MFLKENFKLESTFMHFYSNRNITFATEANKRLNKCEEFTKNLNIA